MCGFAGFFGGTSGGGQTDEALLAAMADRLLHRGPDDGGVWCDAQARVGFGHRRLSIVDLSPAGHQPMASGSGRYVMAFNGEIYNHLDLREQLGGLAWRGHSDTETLLAGFDAWGIQGAIERCIGMFAFAVWDRANGTLTLVRDRLGEKPLYYGWQGTGNQRTFLFGSELKALRAHPAFAAQVDRGALSLLLRHAYVPAPYSIYQGIAKLEPGCLLTVSVAQPEPRIHAYWSAVSVARAATASPFAGSPDEAVAELERLARDAVARQMMADVPLGAFLSGGVDSSTVVALMQVQSSRPVKTFTIGFSEDGYNEAVHAKAVARHLGTEHTELYVTPAQAMAVIPRLPALYDEPFADSSQIPTYLVSQLARQHVKVSLSGDAGDELFAGYNRYQITASLWRKVARLPAPLRSAAARGITALSPAAWDRLSGWIPGAAKHATFGDKLHKGAGVLASSSVDELYLGLVSQLRDPAAWVINGQEPPTNLTGLRPALDGLSGVERMMALDAISYLPDDILCKVDRAAMGVSLESRVPFLDHRVFEFAWRLPLEYKLRDGQTKWPLRQVLYRHVPRELIERPKMGFGIPLHDWLRGPLRSWAEDLLEESRLRREGFFNPEPVRQMWAEHLGGGRNWAHRLWSVLMFQAWLEATCT
ncbi:MAG: asparagine synthase (glutamine-hydrolyzing) [Burkholderiaceae bacterium]|nr:MAG: asparagine synthase (glutamine-hydrolyzing) [Burkholderiaceae bacterium]